MIWTEKAPAPMIMQGPLTMIPPYLQFPLLLHPHVTERFSLFLSVCHRKPFLGKVRSVPENNRQPMNVRFIDGLQVGCITEGKDQRRVAALPGIQLKPRLVAHRAIV